ncbi:PREDICTED: uncharacterized protein LOC100640051 [Amphimedon queenslandica]|uniref:Ubiquitin-like domain-containing protein n=1 Tax=Amphimedon queenslandica TaxID=400682 RepID=A0A1X7TPN2_AMPQE|nr:PREDICTED: uncharacterized protein LOC100640051 [Amphimedon queenslandica]|eukprot:XP_003390072.1 PREDICTED: uncharacterized protein LOC100640051 [Amphimedon queenslandica]
MGNAQSTPGDPEDASLDLVAAALTNMMPGSKVITKNDPLYSTLSNPQLLTYKILSKNVIVESRPEPDPGIVVEQVYCAICRSAPCRTDQGRPDTIITVQFLNGQSHKFSVDPRATVYGLKWSIFKSKGFDEYSQYDVNNIVLTFGRKELNDDDRLLTNCGIKDGSTVQCAVKLREGAGPTILVLDGKFLDPDYNFDFTHINDTGTEHKRGGHIYKHPCGWKRMAIKVTGQYEDDDWLGCFGLPGEWPVSYHGTAKEGVEGITKEGYDETKLIRNLHGAGHYSTPDIGVAAGYATSFLYRGKWYKAVMQNRVNLENTTIVPKEETGAGAEYYVTPSSDDLRAYGICIKEFELCSIM